MPHIRHLRSGTLAVVHLRRDTFRRLRARIAALANLGIIHADPGSYTTQDYERARAALERSRPLREAPHHPEGTP